MTKSIHTALLAVQGEISNDAFLIGKNATGQAGPRKFSYADIGALLEKVLPILSSNGVLLTHELKIHETGAPFLETRLTHPESETFIASQWLMSSEGNPQAKGAEITYARRYSLKGLLNIQEEDDSDAPKSQKAEAPAPKYQESKAGPMERTPANQKERAEKFAEIKRLREASNRTAKDVEAAFGVRLSTAMPDEEIDRILTALQMEANHMFHPAA